MNITQYRLFLILFLNTLLFSVYSQTFNSRIFIEPNVALNYDSRVFIDKQHYSAVFYGEEVFEFKHYFNESKIGIYVKNKFRPSNQEFDILSLPKIDSFLLDRIKKINASNRNDTVRLYKEAKKIKYKKFNGFESITVSQKNIYSKEIILINHSEEGICEVTYSNKSNEPFLYQNEDLNIVSKFVDGIKIYTKNDFQKEDEIIKSNIKIVVDSIGDQSKRFNGVVKVTGIDNSKIKSILLESLLGKLTFEPNQQGEISIYCKDHNAGKVEQACFLIVYNSLGKQVEIPFVFSYHNKAEELYQYDLQEPEILPER